MPKKPTRKQLSIPRKDIAEFCRRWRVSEFSIFGSALRAGFGPRSDVDVLVVFERGAPISLFDMAKMQIELEGVFGLPVDLVEKAGLQNPYRRSEILRTARVIYAGT